MSIISMSAEDANRIFGDIIPTKGQWYEIDTAPKDGTEILVFDGKQIWLVNTEYEMYPKDNGCGCCSSSVHYEATHWMPLPKPPQDEI